MPLQVPAAVLGIVTLAPRQLVLAAATLILLAGAVYWFSFRAEPTLTLTTTDRYNPSGETARDLAALEAREAHVARTLWAPELQAREHFRLIEDLWDSLNRATNKLEFLVSFPLPKLVIASYEQLQVLPHGIEEWLAGAPTNQLSGPELKSLLNHFQFNGWELHQIEFRHTQFDPPINSLPARSRVYFSAHLLNPPQTNRATIEGNLYIEWAPSPNALAPPEIQKVDATPLSIRTRKGQPPFKPWLAEELTPIRNSSYIDPLILHDLDGDGLSEVILAGRNTFYKLTPTGTFAPHNLCAHPPGPINTALIADFDGDGLRDFLCQKYEGFLLYPGSAAANFALPSRQVYPLRSDLRNAHVMTCGDIDRDNDLDLFIAQYREPYEGGAIPRPYYDATDGYPAYLLINDGAGNFTDATKTSGLAQKRFRRSYSASFAHLDSDSDLDLIVISDFAGIDLYRNIGQGQFIDATSVLIPNPRAFGMAHALADFNLDGRVDILMTGMNSPTVQRLEHIGLWRPGADPDHSVRKHMTYGNRLYVAQPAGGFGQTALNAYIARSGWSWGCSAADFDNDGFPDVYIANGLESNQSVRDYESEFWLHDIFIEHPETNPAPQLYFRARFTRTRGRDFSYGGYERNRLFLNQGGKSFFETSWLFGVALQEDCRNVVAEDLDADGRVDLLVATQEIWPRKRQTVRIFKNELPSTGNWIGFRFPQGPHTVSPIGATVQITYAPHTVTRQVVTGDSYRSQHSPSVHFGLGNSDRLERATLQQAGKVIDLVHPKMNSWNIATIPP